ncbi:DUF2690 domain-containing protein [Amycolatopsis circi]|uniref:DUF2690 domain-containing protein n=1 Tax=Amycolatopsis circi TaxID=871959 RepID=UPI000E22D7B9|nr:DUF2690 domain-containing protein [Amycolatopsis circi]
MKHVAVQAAMALGLTLIPVVPTGAQAATSSMPVSCSAESCYGKNPISRGCDQDAVTMYTAGNAQEWVELRFSSACFAAWIKLHGQPGTSGYVRNTQTRQIGQEIRVGNSSYSLMVNDENGIRAFGCVSIAERPVCTPAF